MCSSSLQCVGSLSEFCILGVVLLNEYSRFIDVAFFFFFFFNVGISIYALSFVK